MWSMILHIHNIHNTHTHTHTTSLYICSYKTLKKNIAEKYAEIESQLVDEFVKAQRSLDTKRMRQYAQALSPFNKV